MNLLFYEHKKIENWSVHMNVNFAHNSQMWKRGEKIFVSSNPKKKEKKEEKGESQVS